MRLARLLSLILFLSPVCDANTKTTAFPHPPAAENPISESGDWVGGSTAGGSLWGNVQTAAGGGQAYGVSEPTQFGDPTAINTGTWGATQTVQGTVIITNGSVQTGGCCHEVEVRLRNVISASSITGYEVYCSIMTSQQYCHIARWNGPNGSYCNIEAANPNINVNNGDVLKGTASGTNPVAINLYVNNVLKATASDTGGTSIDCPGGAGGPFASGNPGMGFYDQADNNWSFFGFSAYTATDGLPSVSLTPAKGLFVWMEKLLSAEFWG